jgi:hypothetical protein
MNINIDTVTLIITVLLAFAGYVITYLNSLRLAKRKERLDLINKRINEFYGPLYVASRAGEIAYKTLLFKVDKERVFGRGDNLPPDEKTLTEWRIWLQKVFTPLNEFREKLILENAYLIREEEMPECLLRFVTHVSAYKAMLSKWNMGDLSEYVPLIDFPEELDEYATTSYRELKAEQLKLIGRDRNL